MEQRTIAKTEIHAAFKQNFVIKLFDLLKDIFILFSKTILVLCVTNVNPVDEVDIPKRFCDMLGSMINDDHILVLLLAALMAYLVGSVNISAIAGRLVGAGDIRKSGSGNAGATNLLRAAGPKVAIPVLLLDIGKAIGVIWTGKICGMEELAPLLALPLIIGNLYPVFHKFQGGKGVATATGAVLAISWPTMLLGGAVFLVVFGIFKRISLASITMTFSWIVLVWMLSGTKEQLITMAALALVIAFSHRANIGRLLRGEEHKFKFRKEQIK